MVEKRWEILRHYLLRFRQKKIIFSDEAYFDLGGYVNKQNCRIWATENQHAYIENPTHPQRRTNMVVYASLIWSAIDLQKIPILAKKKSSFPMKLIVAFEVQKTRSYSLKNRRTQNKSLFGADFSTEA